MFSVPHLVVLFLVVLVLFGPHKLPELARGLGKLMAEFRKASNDFKMAFEEEMRNIERQNREAEWKKSQEEAEAKRQKELPGTPPGENQGQLQSESPGGPQGEPGILPEQGQPGEPTEPIIKPVHEAVARGQDHTEYPAGSEGSAVPAEEATSSDPAESHADDTPVRQPNDQRQPA